MTDTIAVERADIQVVIGYLRNMAPTFANVPAGMDPTFYHTLSYEGDVTEGERISGLIVRLEAVLQKAQSHE